MSEHADIIVKVDDDGWEWRIDRAWIGWFWAIALNGELKKIGWRPTKRMAERKAKSDSRQKHAIL